MYPIGRSLTPLLYPECDWSYYTRLNVAAVIPPLVIIGVVSVRYATPYIPLQGITSHCVIYSDSSTGSITKVPFTLQLTFHISRCISR